jgi:hypothetical protein
LHTILTVLDAVRFVLVVVVALAAAFSLSSVSWRSHPYAGVERLATILLRDNFYMQPIQDTCTSPGKRFNIPGKFHLLLASFSRFEAILDSPGIRRLFDDEDIYCDDGAIPA